MITGVGVSSNKRLREGTEDKKILTKADLMPYPNALKLLKFAQKYIRASVIGREPHSTRHQQLEAGKEVYSTIGPKILKTQQEEELTAGIFIYF
jgi:hypothetical protein